MSSRDVSRIANYMIRFNREGQHQRGWHDGRRALVAELISQRMTLALAAEHLQRMRVPSKRKYYEQAWNRGWSSLLNELYGGDITLRAAALDYGLRAPDELPVLPEEGDCDSRCAHGRRCGGGHESNTSGYWYRHWWPHCLQGCSLATATAYRVVHPTGHSLLVVERCRHAVGPGLFSEIRFDVSRHMRECPDASKQHD